MRPRSGATLRPNCVSGRGAGSGAQADPGAVRQGAVRDKLTPGPLLKGLERILGLPGRRGTAPCCARFGLPLEERANGRRLSVDHEETWLIVAGFLLRPGLRRCRRRPSHRQPVAGARDWPLFSRPAHQEPGIHPLAPGGGRAFARTPEQAAGGGEDRLRGGKAPDELVRLAGALELLPLETKAALDRFHRRRADSCRGEAALRAVSWPRSAGCSTGRRCAPGRRLWSRPISSSARTARSPASIGRRRSCWRCRLCSSARRASSATAAWMCLPGRGRRSPASWRKPACRRRRTARIRGFVPIGRADQASLFDESLPPGLVLDRHG